MLQLALQAAWVWSGLSSGMHGSEKTVDRAAISDGEYSSTMLGTGQTVRGDGEAALSSRVEDHEDGVRGEDDKLDQESFR